MIAVWAANIITEVRGNAPVPRSSFTSRVMKSCHPASRCTIYCVNASVVKTPNSILDYHLAWTPQFGDDAIGSSAWFVTRH